MGNIILDGRRTILGDAARVRLAENLRAEAQFPPFADPRFLALRLGMRLAVRARAEERSTADLLVYSWKTDAREQGWEIHRELTAAYLFRRGVAHSEADRDLLALEVALPRSERSRGAAYLVWSQRHAPRALILDVCAQLRLRA